MIYPKKSLVALFMINKGFWGKLKKPILIMAPLANITDTVFRQIIAKHGKPDVFFTEFISADGLCSGGREALLRDLLFTPAERPIVAQFFGANPENFYKCAVLANELGFDGIDINMGCPDRGVERQGAGAALIKNPKLALEIIEATKNGAKKLPVSVKTRIGYNEISLKWARELLEAELAALIFHLRTRKEMSDAPAHWEVLQDIVKMRNKIQKNGQRSLLIGNGDIMSPKEGAQKVKGIGADGVMFGRAIFGRPWLFNKKVKVEQVTLETKLKSMIEHAELYEKTWGKIKNFDNMKKHFKAYVSGFRGASNLRGELMKTQNVAEVKKIIKNWNSGKIDGK